MADGWEAWSAVGLPSGVQTGESTDVRRNLLVHYQSDTRVFCASFRWYVRTMRDLELSSQGPELAGVQW